MPTSNAINQQQGITLVVTLLILVAMTTLGLTSIRSSSIQQAIVKNTQFLMSARNVAKTEINGQLDAINLGPTTQVDTIIQTLMDTGENTEHLIANTTGNQDVTIENLTTTQTAYSQRVSMTMNCRACPAPVGGFSYGLGVQALTATIQSEAELDNSSATSIQEQGYWYLVPAGS